MSRTPLKRLSRCTAAFCLLAALFACVTGPATAASISVQVKRHDGKPLVGAVLTLQDEPRHLPPHEPVSAVVDQVDLAFVPDILVIPVGSTISFPNSDAVSHQVYSFSSARRFQLPLYRGKPYPPVLFDRPGLVTLGCNIHDNMLAYVIVTDAPFFGRTDEQGEWVVHSLPSGSYRLKIWHPLLNAPANTLERLVHVDTDGARVSIQLSRALRPAPLTSRPHSWEY